MKNILPLWLILITVSLFSTSTALADPKIYSKHDFSRRPYLQNYSKLGTAIVCYRTEKPSIAKILYGTDPTKLEKAVYDRVLDIDHKVKVSGLKPNVKYFYKVQAYTKDGWRDIHEKAYYFILTPDYKSKRTINVWVLGDPGTLAAKEFKKDYKNTQLKVRNAFYALNKKIDYIDLIMTLGDNVYPKGTDEIYQKAFFDVYGDVLPYSFLYPAFGNHDAGFDDKTHSFTAFSYPKTEGTYFNNFELPTKSEGGGYPSWTEAYYSFEYGNAHFIVLDSFQLEHPKSQMLTWLENDLKDTPKYRWKVVIIHNPIMSKFYKDGSYKKNLIEEQANLKLVPLFDKYAVDLVMHGHIHDYLRSMPINASNDDKNQSKTKKISEFSLKQAKQQGKFARGQGTIYIIAGTAGSAWHNEKKELHSDIVNITKAGSLLLKMNDKKLEGYYIGEEPKVLDRFMILK